MKFGKEVLKGYINNNFIVGYLTFKTKEIIPYDVLTETRWAKTIVNFIRDWKKISRPPELLIKPIPFPFGYVPAFPRNNGELLKRDAYLGHLELSKTITVFWNMVGNKSPNHHDFNDPTHYKSKLIGHVNYEMITEPQQFIKHGNKNNIILEECRGLSHVVIGVIDNMLELYSHFTELRDINILASHRDEKMTRDSIIYELRRWDINYMESINFLSNQIYNSEELTQDSRKKIESSITRSLLAIDQIEKKQDMYFKGLPNVMIKIQQIIDNPENTHLKGISLDVIKTLKPQNLSKCKQIKMILNLNREHLIPITILLLEIHKEIFNSQIKSITDIGIGIELDEKKLQKIDMNLRKYLPVGRRITYQQWSVLNVNNKVKYLFEMYENLKSRHMLTSYFDSLTLNKYEAKERLHSTFLDGECVNINKNIG